MAAALPDHVTDARHGRHPDSAAHTVCGLLHHDDQGRIVLSTTDRPQRITCGECLAEPAGIHPVNRVAAPDEVVHFPHVTLATKAACGASLGPGHRVAHAGLTCPDCLGAPGPTGRGVDALEPVRRSYSGRLDVDLTDAAGLADQLARALRRAHTAHRADIADTRLRATTTAAAALRELTSLVARCESGSEVLARLEQA